MNISRPKSACLFLALLTATGIGCASPPATDSGPVFYPPPPQRPRIQFLTSISSAEDVEGSPSSLLRFLVGDTSENRRFRKPMGIADHAGVIYVADPGWDSVLVLDLVEGTFDSIRDRGMGKLQIPVAIAVDAANNKFVADTGRKQVVQFNEKNEFVRAFGNSDTLEPTGVAVDQDRLYIVNRARHRVEVYDRLSKQLLHSVGEFGEREGQFNNPTSLTRGEDGHLFVTDSTNFRIQEFTAAGEFVQSYGFLGDGPGTFARPRGTTVDHAGHLYVTDAAFENVQIWDTSNGQVLLAFGGAGVSPGDMYLPASIHVDYDLVDHFRKFVASGFELEYVIFVINNYGPRKLSVYGFIRPNDPSAYPEYALPDEDQGT